MFQKLQMEDLLVKGLSYQGSLIMQENDAALKDDLRDKGLNHLTQ
jgi:hypothetical protein